ncbi:hypothetical protein TNCV_1534211 [Trichonephila clavipes]|nr:hypothetical protein TNCV_1534211 [Trichonephila clavipes]
MGNAKRRVSAKRKRLFRRVMDLPLNIQKIAAQHLPTPVLQKLKIPAAVFDEEIAEYQRKPLTVDGTWQCRGYSSMNGCVAALSVDTGKVVDIEIMSSCCRHVVPSQQK